MHEFHTQPRPNGAIPPMILSDEEIVRAQAVARRERSQAFLRAVQWGVQTLRRGAA